MNVMIFLRYDGFARKSGIVYLIRIKICFGNYSDLIIISILSL
jgi:hypothetical protein